MNSHKITTRQMILLITTFRLTMVISYMPSKDLPPANQDIWIVLLLSFFYTTFLSIPLLFLTNKYSNLTLVEYLEKILGKFAGKLLGLCYALYFTAYSIFSVILQAQLVGVNVLARTPNWIIIGLLIFISLYIGSKGLVMISWTGEIVTPIALVSIILLILLGLKNVDFALLLPILSDSTFKEINLGAIMASFLVTDIFILAKCTPYLENKKDINKIFIKSVLYSLIIGAIAVIVTQGALGVEQVRHENYPFLIYARIINYTSAFERIDVIYVITWIASNTGRVLFYISFSYMTFKEVFNINKGKVLYYAIGIIVGLISIYIANTRIIALSKSPINSMLIYSSAIFITIIPLLTTTVYFLRRKTLNKEEKT